MTILDVLIIGGGPAGVQLGYFLEKSGRDYLILEAGESPGNFFTRFPRHRTLLSINKMYTGYDDPEINLRWDWNSLLSNDPKLVFKNFSEDYFPTAEELCSYLEEFVRCTGVRLNLGERVERIGKDDGFSVVCESGREYRARTLVMATGTALPYVPSIPGIEFAESYWDVSCDPCDFAGKRVLIIGKGNSAFETADNLISSAASIHLVSPHSLRMAWQSHFVGDLRAVNNNLLDTYQLKSQNAILDADLLWLKRTPEGIQARFAYRHACGEVEELTYDRVIACTGFRFDATPFDPSCRPDLMLDGRLPRQTRAWESTNVEDLYFAGTLTQARDLKKTTSAFIHGFRYNARALHRILEFRHHSSPWPARVLAGRPAALRDAVIERINRSSALWHQFGFLCDVIAPSPDDGTFRYYLELPVDHALSGEALPAHDFYTITLEYGREKPPDPFRVERVERHDVERADRSQFLHPVIRRYRCGQSVAEHHVIEDLASEWIEPVHTEPLLEFFEQQMSEDGMTRVPLVDRSSPRTA